MLYPVQRIKDIQGWIPEEDVDGIDAKHTFVSDCENVDFENGFMKNAIKPLDVSSSILPSIVTDYITQGFEIYGAKYFVHETQGNVFFYVLYKYDAGHILKFVVSDNSGTTELNVDEQNNDVTFTGEPVNLNFALEDGELKVNLNIALNYTTLNKLVMGNLTLAYLKKKSYIPSVVERSEGWYLFPRWLGWTYGEVLVPDDVGGTEDFEDSTYLYGITFPASDPSNSIEPFTDDITVVAHSGTHTRLGAPAADTVWSIPYIPFWQLPTYRIDIAPGWASAQKVRFYAKTEIGKPAVVEMWMQGVGVTDTKTIDTNGVWESIDLKVGYGTSGTLNLSLRQIPNSYEVVGTNIEATFNKLNVDDLVPIEGANSFELAIIAKYFNGERGMILNGFYFDTEIIIPKSEIDWRVVSYEVYRAPTGGGSWVLWGEYKVDEKWVADGSDIRRNLVAQETTTTLIFNYGLKENIKVFTIDEDTNIIGDTILDEAYLKGRVYYVKGDNKVYQSHLSGTGRGQPDSFPFSIENQFGFFKTFRSELNYAVSVTPQDELLIGTLRKTYVYFIQGGQGTVLRILKATNGGQSVINSSSMYSDLEGQPEASISFWFNEEGMYLTPGGRQEPTDVIKASHKNYWLIKADKDKAKIFFNKAKKEIWVAFPTKEVLIYELDFNRWKKYKFDFVIKEYIGNIDNDLYLLGDDDKIYKIDFASHTRLKGFIVTHYSSDTLVFGQYPLQAPEHELKVLQELYVSFHQRSSGVFKMTIIADGNSYNSINFFPNNFTDLVLAPQLLVYGKIKLKLEMPPVGAEVSELGYHFSVPERTPGQAVSPALSGIGMNTGIKLGAYQ